MTFSAQNLWSQEGKDQTKIGNQICVIGFCSKQELESPVRPPIGSHVSPKLTPDWRTDWYYFITLTGRIKETWREVDVTGM